MKCKVSDEVQPLQGLRSVIGYQPHTQVCGVSEMMLLSEHSSHGSDILSIVGTTLISRRAIRREGVEVVGF